MVKKTGFILLLLLAAQCAGRPQGAAPTRLAFADSYTQDGKPCPPECVSDSMEIVTWYPSPYNEYEELRLYPKRSSEESQCNSFEQLGLMYYNQDQEMLKVCRFDSSSGYKWEPVSYWKSSGANVYNLNSGYVGIGKDNPSYDLDVQGKINTVDALCIGGDCKTSWSSVSGGMSSSQINTASVNINTVKGYSKITVDGKNYAIPYYTYGSFLVNSKHNDTDCISGSGIVVTDGANSFCKFSSSAVPSGWTQYQNWSSTKASTAKLSGGNGGQNCAPCSSYTPNPGTHSWANIAQECGVFKDWWCAYDSGSGCEWSPYGPSDNSICSPIYEIGGY